VVWHNSVYFAFILICLVFYKLYVSASFIRSSFFFSSSAAQRGLWPPRTTRFFDHTQRRATVDRTPLDECSARRRNLYLITNNTHNRQTSMPPVGFNRSSSGLYQEMFAYSCKFVMLWDLVLPYKLGWESNWMYVNLYVFLIPLYIFAVHVSDAVCTHPQEPKLQRTAIGCTLQFVLLRMGANNIRNMYSNYI
jgi:hypothetical protein